MPVPEEFDANQTSPESTASTDEVDFESDDEIESLVAIAQLDAEAAMGYQVAIDSIEEGELRHTFERFRSDHLRHIRDLNGCIEQLGGEPLESLPDPDDSALVRFTEAVGPMGPRALILAILGTEQLTNATYDSALELVSEAAARQILEQNADDERRHLKMLVEMRDRDWDAEEARAVE